MIIRRLPGAENNDKIFILEALGDQGVRITDWNNCRSKLGQNKFFQKIVYRQTVFERNQE